MCVKPGCDQRAAEHMLGGNMNWSSVRTGTRSFSKARVPHVWSFNADACAIIHALASETVRGEVDLLKTNATLSRQHSVSLSSTWYFDDTSATVWSRPSADRLKRMWTGTHLACSMLCHYITTCTVDRKKVFSNFSQSSLRVVFFINW
jgi:hypothetical protein